MLMTLLGSISSAVYAVVKVVLDFFQVEELGSRYHVVQTAIAQSCIINIHPYLVLHLIFLQFLAFMTATRHRPALPSSSSSSS